MRIGRCEDKVKGAIPYAGVGEIPTRLEPLALTLESRTALLSAWSMCGTGLRSGTPLRSCGEPAPSLFLLAVTDARDPFRTLRLAYDARPEDVRQAFRRLARETHPDQGGSAGDFHRVRSAYGVLTKSLEEQRRLWRPSAPEAPPSRYAGGLDPTVYPTCPIRVTSERNGKRTVTYDTDARPDGWVPGSLPPSGGTCTAHAAATPEAPAFGIWTVPLDAHRFRCVFGPPPS